MGFEPTALGLGCRCSTTELLSLELPRKYAATGKPYRQKPTRAPLGLIRNTFAVVRFDLSSWSVDLRFVQHIATLPHLLELVRGEGFEPPTLRYTELCH